MSEVLADTLERLTRTRPTFLQPVSGGMIAKVFRAALGSETVIVKWDEAGKLGPEKVMLRYLGEHSSLPVPEVLYSSAEVLVLECLPGNHRHTQQSETHAAELLASLHEVRGEHYGFAHDTVLGPWRQPNPPSASWPVFFRDQRLLYMAQLACETGKVPPATLQRIETLGEGLEARFDTPEAHPPYPSLVHGDLWRGNVLSHGGRVTGIIDPAIYFADAEMELAYIALFSTLGPSFWDHYFYLRPPRPGYQERFALYALHPLLTHTPLFGGKYLVMLETHLENLGA